MLKENQEKVKWLVRQLRKIEWKVDLNTPLYSLITCIIFLFGVMGIDFFIFLVCGLVATYIKVPFSYLLMILSFGFGLVAMILISIMILISLVRGIFVYWKKRF